MPEAHHFDFDALVGFGIEALVSTGVAEPAARLAAESMVQADALGAHTHGVWYLPQAVAELRGGGINPNAEPSVLRESAAGAVVDGQGGLGGVVASYACELAAEKARSAGCSVVLVQNSNHFGAAGVYVARLAERACIGIIASNARPVMVAPGGSTPVLGAHPLAYAVPDPDGQGPVLLDMALSATAATRIVQAQARGEQIPAGWLVDAAGRPSTDPNDLLAGGALLPAAGHKGFGLAVLIEILAGALSGAGMTHEVLSHDLEQPSRTGHCVIALDIAAFMDVERFRERVARLRAEFHSAGHAEGAPGAMLPGERAFAAVSAARHDGVEVSQVSFDALVKLADDVDRRALLDAAVLG